MRRGADGKVVRKMAAGAGVELDEIDVGAPEIDERRSVENEAIVAHLIFSGVLVWIFEMVSGRTVDVLNMNLG